MKTLHVISHTHWDREWYLTFQQFRLKLVHLIDGLLDILAEDPNFKTFMLDGQTIVLDDYLHMRPEKEEELRRRIQEGRLVIGPWHILPDMFLVGPEAHIRNLLEGARTTRRFGPRMPIGYIPDPFGHPGQVPQILKGFGIDSAALWRGVSDLPAELWWEAPDGSRVLLAHLRNSYGNGASLPVQNPELFTEQIAEVGDALSAHSAVADQLVMFGTDHMEPSPHTSAAIAYANAHLPGTQVIHSTLPAYIESIRPQIEKLPEPIPTIRGELRACERSPLLPGVLSTRMWIKQRNQHSQVLLEKWAEPFSVFAENMIGGGAGPVTSSRLRNVAPLIRQAWRQLMENHPHDSICGCSIDQVHDEMRPRFDQVDQVAEELTLQALQALSHAADTRSAEGSLAVVLFNPFGQAHRHQVEVALSLPQGVTAFELRDADQSVIPHEFIGASDTVLANVLLKKDKLRDTIGAIHEGFVAGMAIVSVKLSRQGDTVTIDAVLDENGQPNIAEWRRAASEIAAFESDPTVAYFHALGRTRQASKIRFISPEIPPLGWRTLWVHALPTPASPPAKTIHPLIRPLLPLALRLAQSRLGGRVLARLGAGDEGKPPFMIENEYFRIEASPQDGTLSVLDKHTQALYTGLNQFVDGGDAGDEYNYSPPQADSFFSPKPASIRVFRHRLIPTLEIAHTLKVPGQLSADRKSRSTRLVDIPITSRISLAPGLPRIDVHTEVDNLARDHRLRVHFPAPFAVEAADHDGHFEVVRRPLGVPPKGDDWVESPRPEVPQRAFTSISNGKIGLTVANRGLPEVEAIRDGDNTQIALTLLRCVGWLSRDDMSQRQGHAGPALETPGGQVPGRSVFEYAIIPHEGDWHAACHQAYAFQTDLRAVETSLHPGEIPAQGSFISSLPGEFVISAVKAAGNGKGWLVRGYNLTPGTLQFNLKPLRRFSHAALCNLAEQELSPLQAGGDGSVTITVAGHGIVSVMFSD